MVYRGKLILLLADRGCVSALMLSGKCWNIFHTQHIEKGLMNSLSEDQTFPWGTIHLITIPLICIQEFCSQVFYFVISQSALNATSIVSSAECGHVSCLSTESLCKVKELRYLGLLFTGEGKMQR